jgi:hypothetical protein
MSHDDNRDKTRRRPNIFLKDLLHSDREQERPLSWWLLFAPGKVVLWFAYMFPHGLGGVFGGARRINSPIVQVWYSLLVYLVLICILGLGLWQLLRK